MTPPQSDYDKRTEELAEELSAHMPLEKVFGGSGHLGSTSNALISNRDIARNGFTAGRLSAKQSLADACRALEKAWSDRSVIHGSTSIGHEGSIAIVDAITKIKKEGNWPI